MELLNSYFDSLIFQYLEEKRGHAVYGAAIYTQLAGDTQRCVLAFVPAHLGVQREAKLRNLSWVNLQMRICDQSTYSLKPQAWNFPYDLPNLPFKAIKRQDGYTSYVFDGDRNYFPIEMMLIHDPRKKSQYQYQTKVNLHWAIDQFHTVFNVPIIPQPIRRTPVNITAPRANNPLENWVERTRSTTDNKPPSVPTPEYEWI